ncbi:hypothetical protein DFR30_2066 [Thiogranum longum]|uniref:Porin n=1 Tax=Thiogranum longum TaxID=1537524 RepID=A0A4R1HNE3_9GAMM|nr:hypothetical protein [Thiogranum longum]TCK18782.1 hypothetical protein DFR30_2066 [Thiogranum longum]
MFRRVLLLLFLPIQAQAGGLQVSGFLAGEAIGFVSNAAYPDQFDGVQAALIGQPEFRFETGDRRNQYAFIPFAHLDSQDQRRTRADLREAWWLHITDKWELLAGVNRVFWGVTESNHLVDIINQTDQVGNIDGEDKLGQPMLQLSFQRDWGDLALYVLPGFRERTFPGKQGRLRFPLVIDGEARYSNSQEQRHVDVAARYSHYIGDWDFGLSIFHGTGREPRFVPDATFTRFFAVYDIIDQASVDIQYTHDSWLWKFEGLWRSQNGNHFVAAVGGFEYTLYQIVGSSADLGLLLEVSRDGRDDDFTVSPPTVLDDDIFAGARLALNDTQSSELLAGVIVDRNDRAYQLSVEAERRLGDRWKLELESRWFLNTRKSPVLSAFKQDSHVTFRLSRYF